MLTDTDDRFIIRYPEQYKFNIDPYEDSIDTIKNKINELLEFLDTKRHNIIALAESLYLLFKKVDRICRYKDHNTYKNLTDEDCERLKIYIQNRIEEFLKKPVEDSNMYDYVPLSNKWVVVSPHGFLWLIYGDTEQQIQIVSDYLLSIINENPSIIEYKLALEFVDKFLIIMSTLNNQSVIPISLSNDNLIKSYRAVLNIINKK